jgi:1-phosphatidylinositol phosphodiesterase
MTERLRARLVLVLAVGCAGCMVVTPGPTRVGHATDLEYGTDRPGMDINNFDLPSARPEDCRDACMNDARCVAFTYVNPGVQGPSARCWLKNPVPNPNPNNCCVSGVKPANMMAAAPAPAPGGGRLEMGTNRAGSDYRDFDIRTNNPEACRDACMGDPRCMAFTYVNPGVQGQYARCWLKNPAPPPTPDGNCISGVK